MTGALLDVTNVTVRFGGIVALDNVTLNVARGSIQAVIGPNGAGKSTLLNVITGLNAAAEGTVSFEGEEDRKPRAACADPNGHRTDFSKHRTIRRDERSRERHDWPRSSPFLQCRQRHEPQWSISSVGNIGAAGGTEIF